MREDISGKQTNLQFNVQHFQWADSKAHASHRCKIRDNFLSDYFCTTLLKSLFQIIFFLKYCIYTLEIFSLCSQSFFIRNEHTSEMYLL